MQDQIKNGMTRQMNHHGRDEPQWQLVIQHKMETVCLSVSTVCMTADASSDEEWGWMKNEGHISTKGGYSVF